MFDFENKSNSGKCVFSRQKRWLKKNNLALFEMLIIKFISTSNNNKLIKNINVENKIYHYTQKLNHNH